jgi:hypothetical protein
MKAERIFAEFESFERFLSRGAALADKPVMLVARETSFVLQRNVCAVYGDNTKFEQNYPGSGDLAESTQKEREREGFTPNDPLLRDGTLLRDNVERFSEGFTAAAGTSEIVNQYHEEGYVNWRSGKVVPPRPTFKIGLKDSEAEVVALLDAAVGSILGFGGSVVSQDEIKNMATLFRP